MAQGQGFDLETFETTGYTNETGRTARFIQQLSSRNRNETKPKTPVEVRLLELTLGRDFDLLDKEARFYLEYLKKMIIRADLNAIFHQYILPEYHTRQTHVERVLWLICEVLEIYRESSDLAIQKALQLLRERNVLKNVSTANDDSQLKLLIFNIIGWTTMLFEPSRNRRVTSFNIVNPCPASGLRTSVVIDKSQRPLDELLRTFGALLPKRMTLDDGDDDSQLTFQVSYLSVATLRSIGKISISWVDSLSTHLSFDPSGPSLCLFRIPSICKLQQSDNSVLTLLSQKLYVEGEEPGLDFSIEKVLGEILRSYALMFRDSRPSRQLYRNTERKRASFKGDTMTCKTDPLLDELCGLMESKISFSFGRPVRDSYNATTDFPIFKDRLKKIQLYMQGIQPNRFQSLWQDRRDLRLWYTIWTVIFLGVISIVQSFVSIGLAAAQLRVAQNAYDLQKKTPP